MPFKYRREFLCDQHYLFSSDANRLLVILMKKISIKKSWTAIVNINGVMEKMN
jgi:hypothetical protein